MIETSSSEEDKVVIVFLKAEIDSPRVGSIYNQLLSNYGLSSQVIIDYTELLNKQHNLIRKELLKRVRGYKANNYLFAVFPADVIWRKVQIKANELS